jgi:hypothetical protein
LTLYTLIEPEASYGKDENGLTLRLLTRFVSLRNLKRPKRTGNQIERVLRESAGMKRIKCGNPSLVRGWRIHCWGRYRRQGER